MPAEVALRVIYTMDEALRGTAATAHEGGGCDQSIGSTVSDAIVHSWLWLTASLQLGVPHWAALVHYCK